MVNNLYIHFPFCRAKCSYCTLYSRVGIEQSDRDEYVRRLVDLLPTSLSKDQKLKTIYFGGGTPSYCNLNPIIDALQPYLDEDYEFTIELHPRDVNRTLLESLKTGGVNRISIGVQSLDDKILQHMGRGYTFDEAEAAVLLAREYFENVGIDLIVGYPGESAAILPRHSRLANWGLKHCSVYSLQNERGLKDVIEDDVVLDRISQTATFLATLGLKRYEISNYAVPGYECRHNMAVWSGEDYIGLGEGACGRIGLKRTIGTAGADKVTTVDEELDRKERTLFRLRTKAGLDASKYPQWWEVLEAQVSKGLLTREDKIYRLTERGTEVCDAILVDLI